MSIIIMGLGFMVAVTTYMLETHQPAKMFPLVVPDLWQAVYGQEQQGGNQTGGDGGPLAPLTEPFQDLFGGGGGNNPVTFDELNQEDLKPLLDHMIGDLMNDTTHTTVFLYPDGTLSIRDDNGTSNIFTDDINISAFHNFTAENGYIYRDGTIFLPDNRTELFS